MAPPNPPTSPAPDGSVAPRTSAQRGWRVQASAALLVLGVLLVVASAFLPWLRYSVHRGTDHGVSNTTYSVWSLPAGYLFPCVGWAPLAIIVWALIRRLVGGAGKPIGRVGLIVLSVLGVVGALVVTGLSEFAIGFSGAYWGSRSGATAYNTLLPGWWLCIAGFGVLIVGSLLLGRRPASEESIWTGQARERRFTLFVPGSGIDSHRG